MIPYVYLRELIDDRVMVNLYQKGDVIYIEDDLYDMWDKYPHAGYYDVGTPQPNLMYRGRIIRPKSHEPSKPKCCCCCKGCCHE